MLKVKPENIPAELQELPQWVLWKMVERNGETTKMPFQPDGKPAKANDRQTWSAFADCRQAYLAGEWHGIGFEFSADDPFCGIDLDGCRNAETGVIAEWARGIIVAFGSYAEVSPSQTGVKVFIRGKLPFDRGRKTFIEAEQVCDKKPGIEVYDGKRYFAVTGQRLRGMERIVEGHSRLEALCKKYWPEEKHTEPLFTSSEKVIERARKYLEKIPPAISGQRGHDTAFYAACVLVLGFGLTPGEAYPVYAEWNQTCQPPWSEKEMRHKLDDANKQPGERNYLRNAPMQDWQSIHIPAYKSSEPPLPEIITLEDAAKRYLDDLKKNGDHLQEFGIEEVDYAIGGGMEFGEFVIIAARPGHGKTAIGLQSLAHATKFYPGLVISEEMSALALGKRNVQFVSKLPQPHWADATEDVRAEVTAFWSSRKGKCFIAEKCRTAERAAEVIRRYAKNEGVRFVALDYAQLLQSKGNGRYEQITNTSIILRQVTSETNVILLCMCQLNREIESRKKFIPQLSDLKDSGQLEQDADVIMFLVWPHRINEDRDQHEYQIFIEKVRNRAINQSGVKCKFFPDRQQIVEAFGASRHPQETSNWPEMNW